MAMLNSRFIEITAFASTHSSFKIKPTYNTNIYQTNIKNIPNVFHVKLVRISTGINEIPFSKYDFAYYKMFLKKNVPVFWLPFLTYSFFCQSHAFMYAYYQPSMRQILTI